MPIAARDESTPSTATTATNATPAANAANDASDIEAVVQAWALAWSARDVAAYAAAYTPDYRGDTRSHRAWLEIRKSRITPRKFIHVEVSDLEVVVTGDHARARFLQRYVSNLQRIRGEKVLDLVRGPDSRWRIERESEES